MATVYLAQDPAIDRPVAIKLMAHQFAHDQKLRDRFNQEARLVARLKHPAIIDIYDFGEYDDQPYLVMPYLTGGSLRDRLTRPFTLDEVVSLLDRLGPALESAHRAGVIHRDIKPDNILFDDEGNPYLSDFGIARQEGVTFGTAVLGTPSYISPEQVTGDKTISSRSDIYSLGAMVYELLAGRPPFLGDTATLLSQHVQQSIPDIQPHNPDLPFAIQPVLEKAMAKEPANRYPTVTAFINTLRSLLSAGQQQAITTIVESRPVLTPPTRQDTPPPIASPEVTPATPVSSPNGSTRSPYLVLAIGIGGVILFLLVGAILVWPAVKPALTPAIDDSRISDVDGMRQFYVPAGNFLMGNNNGEADEQPQHTIYLDGYWIDETEVTNAMYAQCVADGSCSEPQNSNRYNHSDYTNHPIVMVDWDKAKTYCTWAGRTLPTEAQWEKAARGDDGRNYPWGNQSPTCDLLNYSGCIFDTTPVGGYLDGATPYGALDMLGNVWEWVVDWYAGDYYSNSPAQNPLGPQFGDTRIIRGGSWTSNSSVTQITNRSELAPDGHNYFVGFRCAQDE